MLCCLPSWIAKLFVQSLVFSHGSQQTGRFRVVPDVEPMHILALVIKRDKMGIQELFQLAVRRGKGHQTVSSAQGFVRSADALVVEALSGIKVGAVAWAGMIIGLALFQRLTRILHKASSIKQIHAELQRGF